MAYGRVEELLGRYPLRGIKDPVGTAQDMLDLLGGDAGKLAELEQRIAGHLGFSQAFTSVGQVYPRSLDYEVVTALVQLAAAPSSLAKTVRLMAGHELVTEGFKPGQVGSSAMPHKMNTRSLQARQRPDGHPCAATRVDDRRAGGRPVERGRRLLLGGAPRGPPRRVLRPGRAAGDVPDRARRVRCLPRRRRGPGAGPLPAVPRHHQGPHGRGAGRCRPRGRPRGDQGERRGLRAGDARAGRRAQRAARQAGRRQSGSRWTGPGWTR